MYTKIGNKICKMVICLVLAMMLLKSTSLTIFASESASLSVGNVSANVGEQVTVAFSLDANPGLAGLRLTISYDDSRLRIDNIDSVNQGTALNRLMFTGVSATTYAQNPFVVVWFGAVNDTSTGILLTVDFTVLGNAQEGLATVSASIATADDALTSTGVPVAMSVTQGGVFVSVGHGQGGVDSVNRPPVTQTPDVTHPSALQPPDVTSPPDLQQPETAPPSTLLPPEAGDSSVQPPSPTHPQAPVENLPNDTESYSPNVSLPRTTRPWHSDRTSLRQADSQQQGNNIDVMIIENHTSDDAITVASDRLRHYLENGYTLQIVTDYVMVSFPHAFLQALEIRNYERFDVFLNVEEIAEGVIVELLIKSDDIEVSAINERFTVEVYLEVANINHHRLVAIAENGRVIGGYHDPDSSVFSFESTIMGVYRIVYSPMLRRLYLNLDSFIIYDLAGNAPTQIMDVLPVIQDGRTLVPVRFVAYALGAEVGWNGSAREVTLTLDNNALTFQLDVITSELATLGMDVPAQIMEGRTMVPLRFISEFFGALVTWDGETRSISVIAN